MIQWLAFSAGTLILVVVSWKSLHDPQSHGFYRFFAWEAILALLILNIPNWFNHWSAWYQIISWILLLISIIPLVSGVLTLRRRGEASQAERPDPQLLGFERTTKLVTSGIYQYIRHPLYSSLLLLGWGLFFKAPSQTGITLVLIASLLLHATARADETECIQTFGEAYREYMRKTKMFIPAIF